MSFDLGVTLTFKSTLGDKVLECDFVGKATTYTICGFVHENTLVGLLSSVRLHLLFHA
jgi:hypothetical protein